MKKVIKRGITVEYLFRSIPRTIIWSTASVASMRDPLGMALQLSHICSVVKELVN
jgi:hypothetical protein